MGLVYYRRMKQSPKWIIGIDEAGRGPLAGPVAVGVVCVPRGFKFSSIKAVVKDSKQLSESKREEVFKEVRALQKEGKLRYVVSMVSAGVIDRIGITKAVALAIRRGLKKISPPPRSTFVKLDGLLRAPDDFVHQKTIVRGDRTEMEIALASIMAKVARDRYMKRMAARYEGYGFEQHKGYGTKAHRNALKRHRLCGIHRVTFTKNLQR